MTFSNFKLFFGSFDVDRLPEYVEYFNEDNEGIFVSVLEDNLTSFFDWVVTFGVKKRIAMILLLLKTSYFFSLKPCLLLCTSQKTTKTN